MTTVEAASLPVHKRDEAPEHLRTVTQLKAERLKPADGQQPVALLRVYRSGHGWGEFPLYDPAGAVRMRPLSAKQQRAKDARRTCPKCGTLCSYIVYQQCQECRDKAEQARRELYARTCHRCRRVSGRACPKDVYGWHACEVCRVQHAIRKQCEAERRAVWERTCPGRDCTVVTATDEEIAVARATGGWSPTWCPPCKERDGLERAQRAREHREAEEAARVARLREVEGLTRWAREALEDPQVVILDTETTGLDGDARVVDIAVVDVSGTVLLDTLVNPGEPIPPDATDIHGITDAMVQGAPSFASILSKLTQALTGRRCLIYNAPYDTARLRHELTQHYQTAGHSQPEQSAAAWMQAMRFEDAMVPYSDWYGDWSDYWGNYAWQPLYGGGHRALSDCRAVVERLKDMAAPVAVPAD
ncbi:3'-5' exonuclease [Streptomyces sp. NPDC005407]|uniref:3'-5' exonuclease n=1 Tax=Streptomyces sp. NPDC005407 TaxID=3155340 RepID=UPI0033A96E78